jgi:hypothetical protein
VHVRVIGTQQIILTKLYGGNGSMSTSATYLGVQRLMYRSCGSTYMLEMHVLLTCKI